MSEVATKPDRKGFLFSRGGLFANTTISGVGAGVATIAAVGTAAPIAILGAAAIGAGLGYIITNEIREEEESEPAG